MPAEAPAPNLLTNSILVPLMAQDASSSLLKPFINPSDAYQDPTGTPGTSATNETDAPLR
jgi:hypothetical protein